MQLLSLVPFRERRSSYVAYPAISFNLFDVLWKMYSWSAFTLKVAPWNLFKYIPESLNYVILASILKEHIPWSSKDLFNFFKINMISQCSRSRQIWFVCVRVDASLSTSATDINPATNPAFFFLLMGLWWATTGQTSNYSMKYFERILNSTELNENFQNSPKLFRKIEKQHKIKWGKKLPEKCRHLTL